MEAGAILQGRYRVVRAAGAGGMGGVYRADNLATGRAVALKVLLHQDAAASSRFVQEAQSLAAVSHPAIVGYVDHGVAEEGRLFLVMEWIEGEDLAAVLARGAMAPTEALAVARRVAAGLAALHAAGVVHRDLKPANVVLESGDPARARIVDLGIARAGWRTRALTRTGAILGTAGYMAPEQIEASRGADSRADVYALGCVLFECLAGRPAFDGGHLLMVLARALGDEPPRLREIVPGVPDEIDALVARMMARHPAQRPEDGAAALAALERVAAWGDAASTAAPGAAEGVPLRGERRPLGLVLARAPDDLADATMDAADAGAAHAAADVVAARWGARAWSFGADALALVVQHPGGAREQAARSARAALDLEARLPGWTLAVATPSADMSGEVLAAVVDRAAGLLVAGAGGVRLDPVTAALLDVGFDVEHTGAGALLCGFSAARDDARPLLGKLTPCVGREAELRLLEGALAACDDEQAPRAVVVLADAGWGKSKLRREIIARARERGTVRVVQARAEMDGALHGLGIVRSLLADAAGLGDEAGSARWRALAGHVERTIAGASADLVEICGELAGAPPPEPGEALRAARKDPAELRWRAIEAVAAWLRGEARERTVLVSLEDLHQADASSVGVLVEAWKELGDTPVLLVGTARPEVDDLHPHLFAMRGMQTVRLGPLARRAAERLARQALGDGTPADRVARIVDRAGGHPLLLEELVRHAAAARDDAEAPASVLALLQSRLLALDPAARRLLRAASVFGERFPPEGVLALLPEGARADVPVLLDALTHEELVVAPRRGATDAEGYVFRHALVCAAAYDMLPADERAAAHRAAAAWLAARPESDEAAVADQLARAGDAAAAAPWFLRASRRAAERSGVVEAIALARRGQADGVDVGLHVELVVEEAWDLMNLEDLAAAFTALHDRVPWSRLRVGSPLWVMAKASEAALAGFASEPGALVEGVGALLAQTVEPPPPIETWGRAVALLVPALVHLAMVDEVRALLALAERSGPLRDDDPFLAFLEFARAGHHLCTDSGAAIAEIRRCVDRSKRAGLRDRHGFAAVAAVILAVAGCAGEATSVARSTRAHVERRREGFYANWITIAELLTRIYRESPENCEAYAARLNTTDWVSFAYGKADARMSAALAAPGDRGVVDAVFADISGMAEALVTFSTVSMTLASFLAHLELMREHPLEALAHSDRGLRDFVTGDISARTSLRLSRIRALAALGRHDDARAALHEARARIARIASEIERPEDRAAFLAHPLSAETLAFNMSSPAGLGA